MEEENQWKEAEKEKKDKVRKKFERAERRFKKYENQDLDPHDSELDREEEKGKTSGLEGLYNRGRKAARHKRVFFSDKDATLKKATLIDKKKLDDDHLKWTKNTTINNLVEIEKQGRKLDHLDKIEIEDKQVIPVCDPKIITAATFENLIKYIGVAKDENVDQRNKWFNAQRIEEQGRRPNKMKKTMRNVDGKHINI